jgi:hypothetical protein
MQTNLRARLEPPDSRLLVNITIRNLLLALDYSLNKRISWLENQKNSNPFRTLMFNQRL